MNEEKILKIFGNTLQLSGLQYFSTKNIRNEPTNKKIGSFRKIYFGFYMIFFVFAFYYLPEENNQMTQLKKAYRSMKNLSKHISYIFPAFIALLTSFIYNEKFRKIYMNAIWIKDFTNESFNSKLSFKKLIVRMISVFTIMFIFIYVVITVQMFIDNDHDIKERKIILYRLSVNIGIFSMIKYVFYVELLNLLCEQLCNVTSETFERRLKLIEKLNVGEWKVLKPRKRDPSSCLLLMKVFSKIKEISMLMNDAMGLAVLCNIVCFIVNISVVGFQVLVVLSDSELKKNTSIFNLIRGTYGLFFPIIAIAFSCRRNENIMSKFSLIVDNIQSEYNNEMTEDQAEIMEMLSMNLKALKIEFSLADYEVINLNVIAGVKLNVF